MVQFANGALKEITDLHDRTIVESNKQRRFDRYYFLDDGAFGDGRTIAEEVRKSP
jgi:uncharacterized protein